MITTKHLWGTPDTKERIFRHLTALSPDDRRLRFGGSIGDEAIRKHIDRMFEQKHSVFAAIDDQLNVIGMAELAPMDSQTGEIGVSVDEAYRNKKIGQILFKRCANLARLRGLKRLYTFCLSENKAMIRMAKRENMNVIAQGSETEAYAELEPMTLETIMDESINENVSLIDISLKAAFLEFGKVVKLWGSFVKQ